MKRESLPTKIRLATTQRRTREQNTTAAILKYLDARGVVAERVNSGTRVIPATGSAKRRVFRGARKGTSDIVACFPDGIYTAIEVKRPGARTDPKRAALQQRFRERVLACRGRHLKVTSVDQVARALDSCLRRP